MPDAQETAISKLTKVWEVLEPLVIADHTTPFIKATLLYKVALFSEQARLAKVQAAKRGGQKS